jgi:hypothetical protein
MVSLCAAYCVNLWSHAVFSLKGMLRDNMFGNNSSIEDDLKWSIQNDMLCYSGMFYDWIFVVLYLYDFLLH